MPDSMNVRSYASIPRMPDNSSEVFFVSTQQKIWSYEILYHTMEQQRLGVAYWIEYLYPKQGCENC